MRCLINPALIFKYEKYLGLMSEIVMKLLVDIFKLYLMIIFNYF